MILRFRSVAIVIATAGYAQAAVSGDERGTAPLLIGTIPASAWSQPALLGAPPSASRSVSIMAGLTPVLSWSAFGNSNGSSQLLFLSPLSPLRAALRVATQNLALQTLTAFEAAPAEAQDGAGAAEETQTDAASAARRREVILRQRRKSVLNEREAGAVQLSAENSFHPGIEAAGFSGLVELLTLPSGVESGETTANSLPGGAGLVRVSGHLTDDLAFALTGLAAESAATTWRAGAEFELTAGDRHTIEAGAVYGSRFNAAHALLGGEVDRRSVGSFRLVHAMKLSNTVTTRAGGRFVDAPFLRTSRALDPEFSVLIEQPESQSDGTSYLRFDLSGDTLFPGLEVVTEEHDLIALSEGLPRLVRNFEAQRTWNQGVSAGYRSRSTRLEAGLRHQMVTHALLLFPSRAYGAPYVGNASRERAQMGSFLFERSFAGGQAQAGVEYGYGRFAKDPAHGSRTRDFHQVTTRFDAYMRRSGTGIAFFHRFHEGAEVVNYEGPARPRLRSQRYLVELRQDVPFVPEVIGADMALLVSLRNVYYDDVDRRNLDEFAVNAPPRRITGGIRVKF